MRQLVTDDPLQLLAIELLEQPRRHRDAGVARVTPRGKGVGRRVVDYVDARQGHVGRKRQLADDIHELRRALVGHLACA